MLKTSQLPSYLAAVAAAGLVVAAASPPAALAMTASPPSTTTTTTTPPPTCLQKGYVWDDTQKKCIAQKKGKVPDQSLLQQGWRLARTGHYDLAIDLFMLMADHADPSALNGLGYANRKLGRFDIGITYYRQALAIDPDYVLAREYLGEGYAATGRIDLARAQLAEIAKRCGSLCVEYQHLDWAISDAEAIRQ